MDQGLKQRITGALVLVAAAVIFLPMLLSGQDETVTVEVDVPEPPVLDARPLAAVAPMEMPPVEPVPELDQPLPPTVAPPPVLTPPPESAAPAAEPIAVPPPEVPVPVQSPAAVAVSGDWVIQLASLGDANKASELVATLRGQGYSAYSRAVTINGNRMVRIYAGPLLDRAAATRLRDELERRHGLKGLVVAFDDATRPQP